MTEQEPPKTLREKLMATTQRALPTSLVSRLTKSGGAGLALARQIAKGEDADLDAVARAVASLGELKGLAMKAGQMVAVLDGALPKETRALVATLQTAASATPTDVVVATLRRALGDRAAPLIATLSPAPIAVASVGQVHRARLVDAAQPQGREVIVKVRHPNIEAALRTELDVARRGAGVATAVAGLFGGADVDAFVDEARAGFLGECDYRREAAMQRRFAAFAAADAAARGGDPDGVVVPAVVDEFCADDVLVADYHPGASVFDGDRSAGARDRIGAVLYEFFVGTLYRHGALHADPHPGNFAVDDAGRVVVYDFGCVREFAAADVAAVKGLAKAVIDDDDDAMVAGLVALGGADVRGVDARATLRRLLRGFFAPVVAGGAHALAEDVAVDARQTLRDKLAVQRLRLPGRLLFLFRLRFGLYAVLARLGSVVDWRALETRLSTT